MTHTVSSLTTILLQSEIPANTLIEYLEGILVLRKKYGKKIYSKEMMTSIEDIDHWFASLLRLLVVHNAKESKDIKQIIRQIKQQSSNYKEHFTILTPKDKYTENIEKNIHHMFPNSSITHHSNIDVWIEISWEWWHYKRHLDQDIEKLLGSTTQ